MADLVDDPAYPWRPGHRGVETSVTAAAHAQRFSGTLQSLVLAAITAAGATGLTTNEIAAQLGRGRDSIQPRTSELRSMRKIIDSGQRRKNGSGINAIVWTLPRFEGGPA